jgi:bifunctional DNA-binding transcriptional regulator/antitoxin component of YhaV-PrlF toxin-antitoxin module
MRLVSTVEIEVGLRPKHQLTLPEAAARQLGVEPGDRLVIELDADRPGEVRLRPVRRSYAGALGGIFGTAGEAERYLQEERASWSE